MPERAPLTMNPYFGFLCLLGNVAFLCLTFQLCSLVEKQLKLFSDVWLGSSHRSKNYAWVFVHEMARILRDDVLDEIRNAKLHSLIIDESTDLTGAKHLIMLVKYIKKVGKQCSRINEFCCLE